MYVISTNDELFTSTFTTCMLDNVWMQLEKLDFDQVLERYTWVYHIVFIGGFSGGAEGARCPLFSLYFHNVLRFCFENHFIKCYLLKR